MKSTRELRYYVCLWRDIPQLTRTSSFTRVLDHKQRRTTVGRTPLDEWSTRRRDPYLTTNNTRNIQTWFRWDSNPQSQQASGRRPTPWPRGHWDRLGITLNVLSDLHSAVQGQCLSTVAVYTVTVCFNRHKHIAQLNSHHVETVPVRWGIIHCSYRQCVPGL